jgi:hypothetical protein
MRTQLKPIVGCKYPVSARVADFGLRNVIYRGAEPTMLLTNIRIQTETGTVCTGHAWVGVGKKVALFNPKRGDQIGFNGWVLEYTRFNPRTCEKTLDYAIGRLSGLHRASPGEGESFVDYWTRLVQSGKFVTDRICVPCTAPIPEGRPESCIA